MSPLAPQKCRPARTWLIWSFLYFGILSAVFEAELTAATLLPSFVTEDAAGADEDSDTAKVRLGLRMTPQSGNKEVAASGSPLRYTLRADINRTNHFFFRGFHIETAPKTWNKRTNQYALRISIAKLYGQRGELEERLGDITVAGKLEKQDEGLFVLHGLGSKRFQNKFGQPILDVVAGYQPYGTSSPLSAAPRPKNAGQKMSTLSPSPQRGSL